ncbi:MAG: serine/threonine protein kinase [Bradymonadales bacterium]|nr:serine/threonine protein kinase [Bradymonadales bacterium]
MTSQVQIIQPFKSRYTLLEMLGHGGMGEVYVAHDDELGRDVALKLIHEETSAIPEMRMCFNREARAISLLHHPNVVDIYDFGTTETGQIYLSTELVHGDSLHGISACELPLCTILDLMVQLLEALELAHNRGLIHRDLKAENVLLTFMHGKLWVKLADFGLASLPTMLDSTASLRDDTSFGTPGYMAPEQILHGTNYVGPCTDIYAAGILLYEALSGVMPFDRANALETMRAHLQAPLPKIAWRAHLRQTPESVRDALETVVGVALKKEPWLRFLTARDFSRAIQKIASQVAKE